jgi:eukaryotic-like serine/threonine-protein kinase
MDGQGLQTLYCTSAPLLRYVQWSIDQQRVAFMYNSYASNVQAAGVWILDMQTGSVQQYSVGDPSVYPITWLDNDRVYVHVAPDKLALLDLRQGTRQQTSNLHIVQSVSADAYWDFDTSFNTAQIFFALDYVPNVPNTVSLMPSTGGSGKVIYSSSAFHVMTVRAINKSTLLLMIGNAEGDQSHNGLWKMNTDGSGLTSLYLSGALFPQLSTSRYYWSNVSRNRNFYAFTLHPSGQTGTQLLVGSLNSSTHTSTIVGAPAVFVAGWTTM